MIRLTKASGTIKKRTKLTINEAFTSVCQGRQARRPKNRAHLPVPMDGMIECERKEREKEGVADGLGQTWKASL